MKFSTQLLLTNNLQCFWIYFKISNIFSKNLHFSVLGKSDFAISIVPLYRLLTIFMWLQLNEIFYTASYFYFAMFLDLLRNSEYSLKNLHFSVLGSWNIFVIHRNVFWFIFKLKEFSLKTGIFCYSYYSFKIHSMQPSCME